MRRIRATHGFSLTEILMAVGIMGVGLTMVASVFPVAVEQNRRGRDSTMAAQCARSIAATMRAARFSVMAECRGTSSALGYFGDAAKRNDTTTRDRPAEYDNQAQFPSYTGASKWPLTGTAAVTKEMRVYNPQSFLYEQGRVYDISSKPSGGTAYWPQWNAGNFVPVVYIAPLVNNLATGAAPVRASLENARGPWRMTIVVFKSRGTEAARQKHWAMDAQSKSVGAGGYILNRTRNAGECHLIEYVRNPQASDAAIALAAPPATTAEVGSATGTPPIASPPTGAPSLTTTTANIWYVMPGAVAAYHTIIGD